MLHHERQTGTFIALTINRERLIPMLETIAIGAVVNAPTVQPFDTVKSRHFIYQARREQDLARHHGKAIRARHRELIPERGYVSYAVHARRYGRVLFEFQSSPG
jgi:transposase